jgi:small subunit ribosomal protein S7e
MVQEGFIFLFSYLDPKDQANQEYKVDTFAAVFKQLTGKVAVFEFPVSQ